MSIEEDSSASGQKRGRKYDYMTMEEARREEVSLQGKLADSKCEIKKCKDKITKYERRRSNAEKELYTYYLNELDIEESKRTKLEENISELRESMSKKAHMHQEAPPRNSFRDFLGDSFTTSPRPTDTILEPSYQPDFPRQGLDDVINDAWRSLKAMVNPRNNRFPVLFVQASPGCGKTYLLREIARKNERDCAVFRPFSDTIQFVGITFSNFTPIETDNAYGLIVFDQAILLRLYYALFTKDIDWKAYCYKFVAFLREVKDADTKFDQELRELILKNYHSKDKKLVVLFDEITKIDNLKISVTSEMIRSIVSIFCDEKSYIDGCIFSVFGFKILDAVNAVTSFSLRPVVSIGQLQQLTKEQTLTLLAPAIEGLTFRQLRDESESTLSQEQLSLIFSEHIYYLSCGHPRTIDIVYGKLTSIKTSIDFHSFVKSLLNSPVVSRFIIPAWDVVQAALFGDYVEVNKKMPGSERTYENAIARGEMIASLDSDIGIKYPQVPELLLHIWISSVKYRMKSKLGVNVLDVLRCASTSFISMIYTEEDEIQRNVAANLDSILGTRYRFTATSVEDILLRNDIILSNLRSLPHLREKYESINVRDLYRGAYIGSEVPSMLINAALPLEYYYKSLDDLPADASHCILLPMSLTTPGFDAIVRYPLANDPSKYFQVFYQTKFTVEGHSTTLSSPELFKNHASIMEALRQYMEAHGDANCAGYTVIFNCWRNGGVTGAFHEKLPKNCILLNKNKLKYRLSKVVVNLLDTCDLLD